MSWDLNASFGANGFALPPTKQRWDPFGLSTNANKPLMRQMLAQTDWRARYLAHIRTVLDQAYDWKILGPKIAQLQNLIRTEVQNDPLRLYTFAQFSQNVTQDVQISVKNRTATRILHLISLLLLDRKINVMIISEKLQIETSGNKR